jgi:hypothetical protein
MPLNLTEIQDTKLTEAQLASKEALKLEIDARITELVLYHASLDDNGSDKSYDPDCMHNVEGDGEESVSVESYDPENLSFPDEDQDLAGFEVNDFNRFNQYKRKLLFTREYIVSLASSRSMSCVSERGGGGWSTSGEYRGFDRR